MGMKVNLKESECLRAAFVVAGAPAWDALCELGGWTADLGCTKACARRRKGSLSPQGVYSHSLGWNPGQLMLEKKWQKRQGVDGAEKENSSAWEVQEGALDHGAGVSKLDTLWLNRSRRHMARSRVLCLA